MSCERKSFNFFETNANYLWNVQMQDRVGPVLYQKKKACISDDTA